MRLRKDASSSIHNAQKEHEPLRIEIQALMQGCISCEAQQKNVSKLLIHQKRRTEQPGLGRALDTIQEECPEATDMLCSVLQIW